MNTLTGPATEGQSYTDMLCGLVRALVAATEAAKAQLQIPLDGARWDGCGWLEPETEDERAWLVLDSLICNVSAATFAGRVAERRGVRTPRICAYELASTRASENRGPEDAPVDLLLLMHCETVQGGNL